jgi:hypothetical protein
VSNSYPLNFVFDINGYRLLSLAVKGAYIIRMAVNTAIEQKQVVLEHRLDIIRSEGGYTYSVR